MFHPLMNANISGVSFPHLCVSLFVSLCVSAFFCLSPPPLMLSTLVWGLEFRRVWAFHDVYNVHV